MKTDHVNAYFERILADTLRPLPNAIASDEAIELLDDMVMMGSETVPLSERASQHKVCHSSEEALIMNADPILQKSDVSRVNKIDRPNAIAKKQEVKQAAESIQTPFLSSQIVKEKTTGPEDHKADVSDRHCAKEVELNVDVKSNQKVNAPGIDSSPSRALIEKKMLHDGHQNERASNMARGYDEFQKASGKPNQQRHAEDVFDQPGLELTEQLRVTKSSINLDRTVRKEAGDEGDVVSVNKSSPSSVVKTRDQEKANSYFRSRQDSVQAKQGLHINSVQIRIMDTEPFSKKGRANSGASKRGSKQDSPEVALGKHDSRQFLRTL